MIEIRTYEEDAVTLSRFTEEVWTETYGGKMLTPLWGPAHFEWQLLSGERCQRDYLVAAYEGRRLVGCLLAEPFRFRSTVGELSGTMGSWLTVHPEYRGGGIGRRLFEELRRRHAERGARFQLGFIYSGSAHSKGPRHWLSIPDYPELLCKVGFWVRALDHWAVARFSLSRLDRVKARGLGVIQRSPRAGGRVHVDTYNDGDLERCRVLAAGLSAGMDLSYIWTADRLGHQLSFKGVPRTLVCRVQGRVEGFLNYHHLDLLGGCRIRAAVIDLVAFGSLKGAERTGLVRAALARMKGEGAAMAMLLRLPCYPWRPLVAAGFMPMPKDLGVLSLRTDRSFSLKGCTRLHVHWR